MWSAFQQSILGKPSKHFMAPGLMVSWWRSSIYVWIATTSVSHKPWTTARPSSPPAPAWTACLAWTSDPAHWVSLEAQANGHHHPLCSLFCYIRGSYILFTRENRVQELLQLGDLWHPVSLSAICKQWCFNLWAAVFFSFFLFFGIKESKGDAHTGMKPVERELLGLVGTFWRGGWRDLCPSHVWCKWTQISTSTFFLCIFFCFW